jgi:hypothetical protein
MAEPERRRRKCAGWSARPGAVFANRRRLEPQGEKFASWVPLDSGGPAIHHPALHVFEAV